MEKSFLDGLAMVIGYIIGGVIGLVLLLAFLQRKDIIKAWRYKRWKKKMGRAPSGDEWNEVFSPANAPCPAAEQGEVGSD